MDNEKKIRQAILRYDIEVPSEKFQEEYEYIRMQLLHRMRYDTLTGGDHHFYAQDELASMDEEIREAALFEAKEALVLKDVIRSQGITVTREELEQEAISIARRQNSTVEMLRKFFGDDLAMIERDIQKQKAREWLLSQT